MEDNAWDIDVANCDVQYYTSDPNAAENIISKDPLRTVGYSLDDTHAMTVNDKTDVNNYL